MGKSSIFGPNHIGAWLRMWLGGGHEVTAQVVRIDVGVVEVREQGSDDTWHIPSTSVVAWQVLAARGDQVEVGA